MQNIFIATKLHFYAQTFDARPIKEVTFYSPNGTNDYYEYECYENVHQISCKCNEFHVYLSTDLSFASKGHFCSTEVKSEWLSLTAFSDIGHWGPCNPYK